MTKKKKTSGGLGHLARWIRTEEEPRRDKEEDKAVFIGFALVRGVKMYFDVKPEGCREHIYKKDFEDEDEEGRRRQRRPNMNPALVVTNDWNDANVYHVFAVTEEALCEALANEPRYLGIHTGRCEGGSVGEERKRKREGRRGCWKRFRRRRRRSWR